MNHIKKYKLFENKLDKEVLFANFENISYVKRWLDEGGDIDAIYDNYGWTLLNLNANNYGYLMMEYLLKNGANPNIPNKYGTTPLQLSRETRYVKLLVSYGADLTVEDDENNMALTIVLKRCQNFVVEEIISMLEKEFPVEYGKYKTKLKRKEFNL